MTVLIIGSGGREHALYRAIFPHAKRTLCAPGNGGIPEEDRRPVQVSDLVGIVGLVKQEQVGLVVIGSEAPLVAGLADLLAEHGIKAFGPSARAARLEASKIFTASICASQRIPAPKSQVALTHVDACRIVSESGAPIVIKADGLCGGKGVVVAETLAEAHEALKLMMVDKVFGDEGARVVIQEKLVGREVSVMVFCDGENAVLLPPARDYKRRFDGDKGPNTGGMGAMSPPPDVDEKMISHIKDTIIIPALQGMKGLGTPFHGLLYAGVMLTADGPKLLEFNVRFGDPETQVVLPRLQWNIVEYMLAATRPSGLAGMEAPTVKDGAAVCVVIACEEYPGKCKTGHPIKFAWKDKGREDMFLLHAGTEDTASGLVTSGGRVISAIGVSDDVEDARWRAYKRAEGVSFKGKSLRTDIGFSPLPS